MRNSLAQTILAESISELPHIEPLPNCGAHCILRPRKTDGIFISLAGCGVQARGDKEVGILATPLHQIV